MVTEREREKRREKLVQRLILSTQGDCSVPGLSFFKTTV